VKEFIMRHALRVALVLLAVASTAGAQEPNFPEIRRMFDPASGLVVPFRSGYSKAPCSPEALPQ
jgi:hypothetical protein